MPQRRLASRRARWYAVALTIQMTVMLVAMPTVALVIVRSHGDSGRMEFLGLLACIALAVAFAAMLYRRYRNGTLDEWYRNMR